MGAQDNAPRGLQVRLLLERAIMLRCVLTSAVALALSAGAYELKRDSTGEAVRWAAPLELVVAQETASRLEGRLFGAIQAAAAEISSGARGLSVSARKGLTTGVGYDFENPAQNQSEVLFPEEWPFDKASLAVTVVTIDTRTHTIVDADIAFNPHYRFGVLDEGGDTRFYDVQNTMTHELGHAVGLAHNPTDPRAVMYPSSKRGEIHKRRLAEDDRAGLEFLYPAPQPQRQPDGEAGAFGCDAAPAGAFPGCAPAFASLAFLRALGRRSRASRRRRLAPLAALSTWLAQPAVAAPLERPDADLASATVAVVAEVRSARTLMPAKGSQLLQTELELVLIRCVKGSCPARLVVKVPGGKWGHFEQLVGGHGPPGEGEAVALAFARARWQLYRLESPVDFLSFARGVEAARGVSGP